MELERHSITEPIEPTPIGESIRVIKPEKRKNLETLLREGFFANIVMEGYMRENIWSREQVARDVLQNFFDANGQTLDGVSISLNELEDGSTEVVVHADQAYSYNRLVSLGGGHKEDLDRSAGGKHQGTKDMAVMLLREYGCEEIEFCSRNWRLHYYKDTLPDGFEKKLSDDPQQGLYIKLEDAEAMSPRRLVTNLQICSERSQNSA